MTTGNHRQVKTAAGTNMGRRRAIFAMLLPLSLTLLLTSQEATAMSQTEFFQQYRQAMIDKDRETAQSLVDSNSRTAKVVAANLVQQGQGALKEGSLDDALGAYRISLNILEQLGDELNVALVSNDLAVAYFFRGEKHPALLAARRAHDTFVRYGNSDGTTASKATIDFIFGSFSTEPELEAFLQEHVRFSRDKRFQWDANLTLDDLRRLRSN